MAIAYFAEDVTFDLPFQNDHDQWLNEILSTYQVKAGDINFIFCSDDHLLDINRTHLNHDFYTDIITFDLSEEEGKIDADIFISIDRVKENAETEAVDFQTELNRVMAHGLLHCIGFGDKTEEDQKLMRIKEDSCLSLRKF